MAIALAVMVAWGPQHFTRWAEHLPYGLNTSPSGPEVLSQARVAGLYPQLLPTKRGPHTLAHLCLGTLFQSLPRTQPSKGNYLAQDWGPNLLALGQRPQGHSKRNSRREGMGSHPPRGWFSSVQSRDGLSGTTERQAQKRKQASSDGRLVLPYLSYPSSLPPSPPKLQARKVRLMPVWEFTPRRHHHSSRTFHDMSAWHSSTKAGDRHLYRGLGGA